MVIWALLDSEELATTMLGCDGGCSAAAEGIKYQIAGMGERLNQRLDDPDGFLVGMQLIARIMPRQNIGKWFPW